MLLRLARVPPTMRFRIRSNLRWCNNQKATVMVRRLALLPWSDRPKVFLYTAAWLGERDAERAGELSRHTAGGGRNFRRQLPSSWLYKCVRWVMFLMLATSEQTGALRRATRGRAIVRLTGCLLICGALCVYFTQPTDPRLKSEAGHRTAGLIKLWLQMAGIEPNPGPTPTAGEFVRRLRKHMGRFVKIGVREATNNNNFNSHITEYLVKVVGVCANSGKTKVLDGQGTEWLLPQDGATYEYVRAANGTREPSQSSAQASMTRTRVYATLNSCLEKFVRVTGSCNGAAFDEMWFVPPKGQQPQGTGDVKVKRTDGSIQHHPAFGFEYSGISIVTEDQSQPQGPSADIRFLSSLCVNEFFNARLAAGGSFILCKVTNISEDRTAFEITETIGNSKCIVDANNNPFAEFASAKPYAPSGNTVGNASNAQQPSPHATPPPDTDVDDTSYETTGGVHPTDLVHESTADMTGRNTAEQTALMGVAMAPIADGDGSDNAQVGARRPTQPVLRRVRNAVPPSAVAVAAQAAPAPSNLPVMPRQMIAPVPLPPPPALNPRQALPVSNLVPVNTADAAPPETNHPRATEPAQVCDFTLSVPQVSRLYPKHEEAWAQAISRVIDGYSTAEASRCNEIIATLLSCPAKLLPVMKGRGGKRSIPSVSPEEIRAMETPQGTRHSDGDELARLLNRSKALAIQGYKSKAVKTLMRPVEGVVATAAEKLVRLKELHPQRVEVVASCPINCPVELACPGSDEREQTARRNNRHQVNEAPLRKQIRRWCDAKAAGPSGWTEELIAAAITAENEHEWMAIFEDIANANMDSDLLRLLRRAKLLGIPKLKRNGDVDVRPIAMGETFVKVAAKLLIRGRRELTDSRALGEFQYAYRSGGCEKIIHEVRSAIRKGDDAILVDCHNAFNSLRRQAVRDVLVSRDEFACLRPLFNAMYVEQGELLVYGDDENCPVICSTEGVRQGDVLGPLLFCMTIAPAIERANARILAKHRNSSARMFAYMDDVTIVGKPDDCCLAYHILVEELQAISLMVNGGKTIATNAQLAAAIHCSYDSCVELLGAFVDKAQEGEKAKVDAAVQDHYALFERLPLLPAQIGHTLLRQCGSPRWGYIVRTHEPAVSKDASEAFTEMTLRCFAAINKMDYDCVTPEVQRQVFLPIRHGGMGLVDWSELAESCYEASTIGRRHVRDPNSPDDEVREDAFWEDKMDAIKVEKPALHKHLLTQKTDMASAWLRGPITAATAQPSNLWRASVAVRLEWAGHTPDEATPFKCVCGFPQVNVSGCTTREAMVHMLGCRNTAITKRHNLLCGSVVTILNASGYSCETEVDIATGKRMDIVAKPLSNGAELFIDVTVVNSKCRSHRTKDIAKLLEAAEEEKKRSYQGIADSQGAILIPFAMDVSGRMRKATRSFLEEIVKKNTTLTNSMASGTTTQPMTFTNAILNLSTALAFGNGLCLLHSHRLARVGIHLNRSHNFFGVRPVPRAEDDVAES